MITLNFLVFKTQDCCDFVLLYDGRTRSAPLLAVLSGSLSTSPAYTSTQRVMFVEFTSDDDLTEMGFNATFASSSGELANRYTACCEI